MEFSKEPLLTLEDISQNYGTPKRMFSAVSQINLSVFEGEFVALLGPSGCGKSTLLRIIMGLQQPTRGRMLYRGRPLAGVNPHASLVFQTFALFPWLTVLGNVEVALKARGLPARQRTTRALDLLDRVGLDGFENAYPRELSGGMRQKVGFARAMAVEPELLCLDEPFSALDVLSAETLRGELLELWISGKIPTRTLFMVTHSIEEAVFLADRIVVMEKEPGRVVQELKVDLAHPRMRKSPPFLGLIDKVYAILAGQTLPEHLELGSAPGEPGRTRSLPHVSINELTGLLEHIAQVPTGREDIFRLAGELKLASDHLLGLVEGAELLGFATITQGDVLVTPLGETFAEAGILARKQIFAARLRRMPLFKWLLAMLQAAEKHQLERAVMVEALTLEFIPEQAERQMDTAVRWGRYAEILAYEDKSELVSLEPQDTSSPEAAVP